MPACRKWYNFYGRVFPHGSALGCPRVPCVFIKTVRVVPVSFFLFVLENVLAFAEVQREIVMYFISLAVVVTHVHVSLTYFSLTPYRPNDRPCEEPD